MIRRIVKRVKLREDGFGQRLFLSALPSSPAACITRAMATLREISSSFVEGVENTFYTLLNVSPLDWPIWLLILICIAVLMIIVGTLDWMTFTYSKWLAEKEWKARSTMPTDPAMKALWANREGPYHPDPAERDRWSNSHQK